MRDYRCYHDPGTPGTPARQHVPGGELTLIFNLAGTLQIEDPDGGVRRLQPGEVYLGGLQTSTARTTPLEAQSGVIASLSPIGAHRLLGGAPQHELVDRSVLVDGCRDLMAQLREAAGDRRRLQRVDAFLRRRMARVTECSATSYAWTCLTRSHGAVRIGELARELGWSRKRLVARFREQVGLSPKTAARLLRFDHAMALAQGTGRSWADVAAASGYADQAHLSREIRAFAGTPARELALPRETNLQDAWVEIADDPCERSV